MEKPQTSREVTLGNVVDAAKQLERFDDGNVPPELRALAEDDADVTRVLLPAFPRHDAGDAHLARGRHQNAGEHFDRRRFTRAIRADVPDQLARFKREGHVVDRDPLFVLSRKKRTQRAQRAGHAFVATEDFAQVARFDYRQDPSVRRSVLFPR